MMRDILYTFKLQIARSDSSQNLWTRQNNRFDSFVYTNKQGNSFLQSYIHQTYEEIQNKKTCQQLTESTE